MFPSSRKPVSGGPSLGAERHISPLETRKQVRFDLHDKLGRTKGEAVYNVLEAHGDKDGGFFDTRGVSGREVDEMIGKLRENHRDNLRDHEVAHVEEILRKHLND